MRIYGREVIKKHLVLDFAWIFKINRLNLKEGRNTFSPSFGGRIWPDTVSPVRSSNFLIWEGDM